MEIHVSSDDMAIVADLERGYQPSFWISWRIDGVSYPSATWIDFGTVILNWWVQVCERLADGATFGKLMFMDGPYEIAVIRTADGKLILRPQGETRVWTVSLLDLVDALTDAMATVITFLEPLPTAARQVEMLRSDVVALSHVRAIVIA